MLKKKMTSSVKSKNPREIRLVRNSKTRKDSTRKLIKKKRLRSSVLINSTLGNIWTKWASTEASSQLYWSNKKMST